MMLKEETAVASGALPVAALRDHLRLGTGFADVGAEDAALEAYLRAAIAAIEARTAKVLLARDFVLTLTAWRGAVEHPLPVAPVRAVSEIRLVDAAGVFAVLPEESYRLIEDLQRPRVAAQGTVLPAVPSGGVVEIRFTAGFGSQWSDLPADLAQAVMLLSAQYFELRHEAAGEGGGMPFGVTALIERWRTVRMLGGGV
ncbi:hypothetical protein BMI90_08230 [Thioclava sp. L04-15]|uniref:head-tail connector protein n=1 Tax=Thioclava sp. L04-15 TaxID=1915318 RepID=UPI000997DEB9|nr:hypothetical protein [Thioclava sp. L04-15]OOY28633.1 hypothetical protein BMI90_08230 [Thioclava sp. L04-15]TNE83628.1 MAG: hypothetical protein EP337_15575 [Paracoccaceae bacterium]